MYHHSSILQNFLLFSDGFFVSLQTKNKSVIRNMISVTDDSDELIYRLMIN